jgi:hypothetical protein
MTDVQPPVASEETPKSGAFLREWGFDVKVFEARAKRSLESTRGDLNEITGALRQTLVSAKQVLLDLQKTRGPVAAELKTGFERAWDEIEDAFRRARQKMRETK